ncbi:MAG: bacteriohemerythrin [Spirochaetota bacterium]|nr:bacteriohemerythrin [Spirochaetota bacterium]
MAFITWEDEFSVGVEAFDNDHRELIKYINNLHAGIISGRPSGAMKSTLKDLENYIAKHFKREQDLMEKHSYPDSAKHNIAHSSFTEKVNEFTQRLESGEIFFSLEMMSFLKNWLINHILKIDMAYKEFFQEKDER